MPDLCNLVLVGMGGRVWFANGRGSHSRFGEVTLEEALASFDRFSEWVEAGNGGEEDDASPENRDLLIRAYGLAEKASRGGVNG
ncbi:hypothetical protein [Aquamicrobium soli]|uniref:DUF982 domain-containing protein n=1 Tax=Aquamicrobium soli TaxID=1811518 RepID=A0ABV7KB91_9HYPH